MKLTKNKLVSFTILSLLLFFQNCSEPMNSGVKYKNVTSNNLVKDEFDSSSQNGMSSYDLLQETLNSNGLPSSSEESFSLVFSSSSSANGNNMTSFNQNQTIYRKVFPLPLGAKVCQQRFESSPEGKESEFCKKAENFVDMTSTNWTFTTQNGGTWTKAISISSSANLSAGGHYVTFFYDENTDQIYRVSSFFVSFPTVSNQTTVNQNNTQTTQKVYTWVNLTSPGFSPAPPQPSVKCSASNVGQTYTVTGYGAPNDWKCSLL